MRKYQNNVSKLQPTHDSVNVTYFSQWTNVMHVGTLTVRTLEI